MATFARVRPVLIVAGLIALSYSAPAGAQEAPGEEPVNWARQINDWRREFLRLRSDKSDPEALRAVTAKLSGVRDEAAYDALKRAYEGERYGQVEYYLLVSLAHTGNEKAAETLALASVTKKTRAIELINELDLVEAVMPYYITYLRKPELATGTAEAIRATIPSFDDNQGLLPEKRLTLSLINALVFIADPRVPVRYYFWRDTGWYPTGSGMHRNAHGRGGIAYVKVSIPVGNAAVLQTLQDLTGQDHSFDQDAWRTWYQQEVQGD